MEQNNNNGENFSNELKKLQKKIYNDRSYQKDQITELQKKVNALEFENCSLEDKYKQLDSVTQSRLSALESENYLLKTKIASIEEKLNKLPFLR
ncbi:20828_t:CDS:2 [Cetraspora pellucida]|uniref:20828_t:CDS:1 n=1 Tax=Cetraspora pellucida TaxID=1433469 RepID=A0A9N9FSQ8_9GLOM|nr:20828_t:CDS:2 [Cetraspora pellucida]